MAKIKLTIDTTDIATTVLGDTDVHFRMIVSANSNGEKIAKVVCVQEIDYKQFIGDVCFLNKSDADQAAKKVNKIGFTHFV